MIRRLFAAFADTTCRALAWFFPLDAMRLDAILAADRATAEDLILAEMEHQFAGMPAPDGSGDLPLDEHLDVSLAWAKTGGPVDDIGWPNPGPGPVDADWWDAPTTTRNATEEG